MVGVQERCVSVGCTQACASLDEFVSMHLYDSQCSVCVLDHNSVNTEYTTQHRRQSHLISINVSVSFVMEWN